MGVTFATCKPNSSGRKSKLVQRKLVFDKNWQAPMETLVAKWMLLVLISCNHSCQRIILYTILTINTRAGGWLVTHLLEVFSVSKTFCFMVSKINSAWFPFAKAAFCLSFRQPNIFVRYHNQIKYKWFNFKSFYCWTTRRINAFKNYLFLVKGCEVC